MNNTEIEVSESLQYLVRLCEMQGIKHKVEGNTLHIESGPIVLPGGAPAFVASKSTEWNLTPIADVIQTRNE